MPKYTMRGIPDIIVVHEGSFIGIEVKRDKGVLSEYQKEFKSLCENNGATYFMVKSLDDVIAQGL